MHIAVYCAYRNVEAHVLLEPESYNPQRIRDSKMYLSGKGLRGFEHRSQPAATVDVSYSHQSYPKTISLNEEKSTKHLVLQLTHDDGYLMNNFL